MQTVETILFDSWAACLIVCGLACFALLVIWRRGGSPRPLLVGLGVAALWIALQTFVTTPRERADAIMRVVERDVQESRTERIAAVLSPSLRAGTMDRGEFLEFVRARMKDVRLHMLQRTRLEVLSHGSGRFEAGLSYIATVELGINSGTIKTRWRIAFERTAAGWRISGIEPESIDDRPTQGWGEIRRP